MTYARHWLLSWGGTLANGADIWANNVRFMNTEIGSPDSIGSGQMEELLDGFVADIKGLTMNPSAYISNAVEVQWVKFNEIDEFGHYADSTTTHARFLDTGTGDFSRFKGAATSGVPSFQSVCITTTTGRQRGPGSKGRLFVPQCAIPVGTDGRINSGSAQTLATQYATFFSNLGNEAGIDETAIAPAVVSNVGSPGPVERITGVKVGNVPDVIRRRKSAMQESYVSAPVSTG